MPLRRAWCLWEIYSTLSFSHAQLSVCMSDAEMASFHRALVEEFDSILTSLCTIDAETAEAGSQKDLDMIFAAVRTLDGGFDTLNTVVMEQMREWLIDSMLRALAGLGLKFVAKPLDYRVCCNASGEIDSDDDEFEEACTCDDSSVPGSDLRLSFGNWYRSEAGTPQDRSICQEHYAGLGRMQKRRWKAVNGVQDLGAQAELFQEQKHELVGDVHGGPEKEAEAAALLIATSNLLGEMNQGERADVAWEDEPGVRKAYEIYMRLYGPNHVRTSDATLALANRTSALDDDQEFVMLQRTLQVRKELLPANSPKIAEALKFMGTCSGQIFVYNYVVA